MFEIKNATKDDVKDIFNFIKALAEYEKMSDLVVCDETILKEWIFDKKSAKVLIAYENSIPVGFALYFTTFSTFLGRAGIHLEDLFVYPEFRSKGYGKALLIELASICKENNYGRLEWNCLDWNTPSIEFYKSIGANVLDEWLDFRLDGQKLIDLANQKK